MAHRAVLMARSEYLRNLLQDNKWSQEERINIEEVSKFPFPQIGVFLEDQFDFFFKLQEEMALMHLFVEYFYTG